VATVEFFAPSVKLPDNFPYSSINFTNALACHAILSFDDEGVIRPADPDGAWNKERAEVTIKVLNLNYGDLLSARKALWEQCNRKINRVLNLMKELQDRRSATKQAQVEEILIDLRNMVSQTEPFSAVVATCVRSQGISWLNKAVVG